MALSNLVYTAGQAPNLVGPGLQVVNMRTNPYDALAKGYDDQQKRNLALQQYREAKLKADLATALYPQQSQLQQALLAAKLNAITNPTNYQVQPSAIAPVSTAPAKVAVTNQDGTTTVTTPNDPGTPAKVYHSDNPFNGPASGLQLQPTQPTYPPFQGITTSDNTDYSTPFSSDDFQALA